MKKILKKVVILSILCISLIGSCGCEKGRNFISDNVEQVESKKCDKYYIINSGYLRNADEKVATIISTQSSLDEFIQKYDNKSWDLEGNEIDGKVSRELKKYDEEYFKNKSLALYYVALTSGSNTVVVSEPEIKEDTIIVKYKINTPEMGTCEMSGGLIVLEVDKSINKISGEIIL